MVKRHNDEGGEVRVYTHTRRSRKIIVGYDDIIFIMQKNTKLMVQIWDTSRHFSLFWPVASRQPYSKKKVIVKPSHKNQYKTWQQYKVVADAVNNLEYEVDQYSKYIFLDVIWMRFVKKGCVYYVVWQVYCVITLINMSYRIMTLRLGITATLRVLFLCKHKMQLQLPVLYKTFKQECFFFSFKQNMNITL